MKVRMIFATPVDRQDWLVGQVYDAPAEVAESLIRDGRAEPAEPKAAQPVQADEAPVEKPRKGRKR